MADRTDAFVSYSHADQAWLQRIKVHLRPLERDHGVVIWQDTNLRGGQRWRQEIDKALAKAKVAILLVSPDFLASDFIHNNELTPLLEAAEKEGLTILSVIVSACAFGRSPLSEFQAINTPDTPLDLMSAGEANKVLVKLFQRVDELFAAPTSPAPRQTPPKTKEKEPEKAASTAGEPTVASPPTPQSAPAPLALLVKSDGQWTTVAVTFSQIGSGALILTLQPDSPIQRAFLTSLNQRSTLGSVVYNDQTYHCDLRELTSFTEGAKTESWKLTAAIKEMPTSYDMTFNGITPIDQARVKARAILLNERPGDDQERSPFGRLFSVSEHYISPLFVLYHTLRRDAQLFQQVAPLVAAWQLQMQRVVTDIFDLTIQLSGTKLTVNFEGQRHSQYQNGSPDTIEVKGECTIPDYLPSDALPLELKKPS